MKIELIGLEKRYREGAQGLVVIGGLNAEFASGKASAIIGRSGVGKSTLLHILGGLDRPTAGQVLYDGLDLSAMDIEDISLYRGRHIGFIFQFHHLLPEFSAEENAAMPLFITGRPDNLALSAAREALEAVGLEDRLKHRPGELSGGEQQRVAIARALVSEPDVLLADEPTGNLDAATAREVKTLLLELVRKLKKTFIVVTHDRDFAYDMDSVHEMLPGGALRVVGR